MRNGIVRWTPAKLAGMSPGAVMKNYSGPMLGGFAGPIASNFLLAKYPAEVPAVINLVGTALLFAFVKNKMWGAGALSGTVTGYIVRKLR